MAVLVALLESNHLSRFDGARGVDDFMVVMEDHKKITIVLATRVSVEMADDAFYKAHLHQKTVADFLREGLTLILKRTSDDRPTRNK